MNRIRGFIYRFMQGRYGTDKLNMTLLWAGVIACVLAMFIRIPVVNLLLTALSYGLLIWAMLKLYLYNYIIR